MVELNDFNWFQYIFYSSFTMFQAISSDTQQIPVPGYRKLVLQGMCQDAKVQGHLERKINVSTGKILTLINRISNWHGLEHNTERGSQDSVKDLHLSLCLFFSQIHFLVYQSVNRSDICMKIEIRSVIIGSLLTSVVTLVFWIIKKYWAR